MKRSTWRHGLPDNRGVWNSLTIHLIQRHASTVNWIYGSLALNYLRRTDGTGNTSIMLEECLEQSEGRSTSSRATTVRRGGSSDCSRHVCRQVHRAVPFVLVLALNVAVVWRTARVSPNLRRSFGGGGLTLPDDHGHVMLSGGHVTTEVSGTV